MGATRHVGVSNESKFMMRARIFQGTGLLNVPHIHPYSREAWHNKTSCYKTRHFALTEHNSTFRIHFDLEVIFLLLIFASCSLFLHPNPNRYRCSRGEQLWDVCRTLKFYIKMHFKQKLRTLWRRVSLSILDVLVCECWFHFFENWQTLTSFTMSWNTPEVKM